MATVKLNQKQESLQHLTDKCNSIAAECNKNCGLMKGDLDALKKNVNEYSEMIEDAEESQKRKDEEERERNRQNKRDQENEKNENKRRDPENWKPFM